MGDYKLQLNTYFPANAEGMQNHLQQMAQRGWRIVKAGPFVWRYRRAEPKPLRFCVAHFLPDALYAPEKGPQQGTCREHWERLGWKYISGYGGLHIFSTADLQLEPDQQEPVVQLPAIHSCIKRRDGFLRLYLALVALLSLMGMALTCSVDPVEILADTPSLVTGIMMLLLLGWSLVSAAGYACWRRKAKKSLTISIPKRRPALHIAVIALVLVLLVLLFVVQSSYERLVGVSDLFAGIVIFAGISLAWPTGEKNPSEKKMRLIGTGGIVVVVAILLGMVQTVLLDSFRPVAQEADMFLTLSQLTEQGDSQSYCSEELQSSPLLDDLTQYQRIVYENEREQLMQYRITKIKLPALMGLCRENCLPSELQGALTPQDAGAWGAEQVWMQASSTDRRVYYMYYADRTVTLLLNWEPDAAQVAMIANMLKTV